MDDEDKVLLEDLKKYVGEGICYDGGWGDDCWYNINFEGDVMMIRFMYMENL